MPHHHFPPEEGCGVPKCPECGSKLVSVWYELWVDFFEDGRREVDPQDLDESEPKYGDRALCRVCGFDWTYGKA
jgi:hypothetical protein